MHKNGAGGPALDVRSFFPAVLLDFESRGLKRVRAGHLTCAEFWVKGLRFHTWFRGAFQGRGAGLGAPPSKEDTRVGGCRGSPGVPAKKGRWRAEGGNSRSFGSGRPSWGAGSPPAPPQGTDAGAGRLHACGGLARQQKPHPCL